LKKVPKTHIGEKRVCLTSGIRKLGIYLQKVKTRLLSLPYTKINSRWIKSFNVRPETETTGIKTTRNTS
jgi:hypothetical protein